MGIEIQEAREKLDILERLADEPQLIFTDLITKKQSRKLPYFSVWGGMRHLGNNYLKSKKKIIFLTFFALFLEKNS